MNRLWFKASRASGKYKKKKACHYFPPLLSRICSWDNFYLPNTGLLCGGCVNSLTWARLEGKLLVCVHTQSRRFHCVCNAPEATQILPLTAVCSCCCTPKHPQPILPTPALGELVPWEICCFQPALCRLSLYTDAHLQKSLYSLFSNTLLLNFSVILL